MHDQTRAHAEGACADPVELEAALQQLKVAHIEQNKLTAEAAGTHTERALTAPQVHEGFIQIFYIIVIATLSKSELQPLLWQPLPTIASLIVIQTLYTFTGNKILNIVHNNNPSTI